MESVFVNLAITLTQVADVHFPRRLDRCLIPDNYVSAAKLHPIVYTVPSHIVNGHEILKMKLNVRPTAISNPLYPKHLTIPSGVFIPGNHGTPVKSMSALQELVRLLHREHDRALLQHHNHWQCPRPRLAVNSRWLLSRPDHCWICYGSAFVLQRMHHHT